MKRVRLRHVFVPLLAIGSASVWYVMLDKTTRFLKDKKAAAMSDIQVGDRVVIDAHMDSKTKKYAAEEVQIGVAAPAAKSEKKRRQRP